MTEPEVRKRLPTRRWNEPASWEVLLDGVPIGRIDEWHTRRARATFYRATVIDGGDGRPIRLESSTDFEERVELIVRVSADPDGFLNRPLGASL